MRMPLTYSLPQGIGVASQGDELSAYAKVRSPIERANRGPADKARATNAAEKNEPDLDIPAECARREKCLKSHRGSPRTAGKPPARIGCGQGRSENDDRKPRDKDGNPKGGKRYKP